MTKAFRRSAVFLALPLIAAGWAGSAQSAAFYLQEQSVRGAGRAFSGEGADTGAASLWWNPAAIGGMTGVDGAFGVSAILPKGQVNNTNTLIVRPGQAAAPVGGEQSARNPINNGYLPSGAIGFAVTPKLAVGLTITAPYSFTTNYSSSSWARYTADKTSLRTYDFQPSVAFAPIPEISLGAALNVEYVKASLSNFLPNLSPLLPDGHQTLKGHGTDVGWSVGGQFRSGPVVIGLSYKSKVKHTLDGTVTTAGLISVPIAPGVIVPLANNNGVVSTKASFTTPSQAIASIRYKVTPQLTLNGQVVRFGWGDFDAIRLAAPLNVALPENYKNSWSYAAGVDFDVTPVWTLRAGVQRDKSPTQNGQRDARVPDSDRWNFSAGTSYKMSHGFTVDAAFSYIDFKDATIDRTTAAYAGTAVQTPILVNGTLTKAHALVLALGGRVSF